MYWYLQVEDVKGNKDLNKFVACLVNFSLLHPCTAFNNILNKEHYGVLLILASNK